MTEPTTSGEHPATNGEVKRWGWAHIVAAVVSAVGGSGGAIVFLLGYAHDVEARSLDAARHEVVLVAQRIDAMKTDSDATKIRLEAIDAGVAKDIRRLEQKIDDNAREQRAQMQEILREVKKR